MIRITLSFKMVAFHSLSDFKCTHGLVVNYIQHRMSFLILEADGKLNKSTQHGSMSHFYNSSTYVVAPLPRLSSSWSSCQLSHCCCDFGFSTPMFIGVPHKPPPPPVHLLLTPPPSSPPVLCRLEMSNKVLSFILAYLFLDRI